MSNLQVIRTSKARDEAERVLGAIQRFKSNYHSCAYCGSDKTIIAGLNQEKQFGQIEVVIECLKCLRLDKPKISTEALKLIMMHC